MPNPFLDESIKIADSFIKTICFIDDEPFFQNSEAPVNDDYDHRLDANTITKAFAASGKCSSFYLYEKENEQDEILRLAMNSDINIIDWRIKLKELNVQVLDDEEDIPEPESRGKYALQLVERIIKSESNSPKLIIILTGENDAESVYMPLQKKLATMGVDFVEDVKNYSYQSKKFRIVLLFKESLNNKKISDDVAQRIIRNIDLPKIVTREFALLISGLVSNAVLNAVTVIRNNTATLLNLFNKELDPAYLGHRILLPKPEDAEDLLINLIKDSIGDLMHYYDVRSAISQDKIEKWAEERVMEREMNLYGLNDQKKQIDLGKKFTRDIPFVKNLTEKGFKEAFKEIKPYIDLLKEQKAQFKRFFELNSTCLFVNDDEYKSLDKSYAKLTHHKSLFKPNSISPKLSLGAIVKGEKSGYWVCIQQRCDSVRLDGKERRFLFLPLKELKEESTSKFHFITSEGVKLQLQKKSFNLRTIKFLSTNNEGVVKAIKRDSKYIFEPFYKVGNEKYRAEIDEVYEWLLDLKDLHAQRIVHEFAHELSRVGLDESEWLRRWSSQEFESLS